MHHGYLPTNGKLHTQGFPQEHRFNLLKDSAKNPDHVDWRLAMVSLNNLDDQIGALEEDEEEELEDRLNSAAKLQEVQKSMFRIDLCKSNMLRLVESYQSLASSLPRCSWSF